MRAAVGPIIVLAIAAVVWLLVDERPPVGDEAGAASRQGPAARPDAPELVAGGRQQPPVSEGPPRSDVQIPRRVHGVVKDRQGNPIAGVLIDVLGPGGQMRRERLGGDGRFELAVAGEKGWLRVIPPKPFEAQTVFLRRRTSLEITLERRGELPVQVLHANGDPAGHVRVIVDGYGVGGPTDGRGSVTVRNLKLESPFHLDVVGIRSPIPDAHFGPFRLADGPQVLRLPPASFIDGIVLTSDGEPVVSEHVEARSRLSRRAGAAASDGRFRLGPFAPGPCTVAVELRKNPSLHWRQEAKAPHASLRITLPPMSSFRRAIDLEGVGRLDHCEWFAAKQRFDVGFDMEAEDDVLYEERLPDLPGTLLVSDDRGKFAYYPHTRLAAIPPKIVLVPGQRIRGHLDTSDRFVSLTFRFGGAQLALGGGSKSAKSTAFHLDVPAGVSGVIEVRGRHDQLLVRRPTRAGEKDVRIRVPAK